MRKIASSFNRSSLGTQSIIAVFAILVGLNFFLLIRESISFADELELTAITAVSQKAEIAEKPIREGRVAESFWPLQAEIKFGTISFWQIETKDGILAYENDRKIKAPIDTKFWGEDKAAGFLHDGEFIRGNKVITDSNGETYRLFIGRRFSYKTALTLFWEQNKIKILLIVSLAIVLLSLSIIFVLRAIRKIAAKASSYEDSVSDQIVETSFEAKIISTRQKTDGLKLESLSGEAEFYRNNIMPAYREEIQTPGPFPRTFDAVMVRVDINHSTELGNDPVHSAKFKVMVDEFLQEAGAIITRYDGHVAEEAGDEIICYFKEKLMPKGTNAATMALFALREIERLANRLDSGFVDSPNATFKIKSALSFDSMTARIDRTGKVTAPGQIWVESERLLKQIDDKDKLENTVVMSEIVMQKAAPIVKIDEYATRTLKGYSKPQTIYRRASYEPLEAVLNLEDLSSVSYYRDDESLLEIINYVRANLNRIARPRLVQLVLMLRYPPLRVNADIANAYCGLLSDLIEEEMVQQKIDEPTSEPKIVGLFRKRYLAWKGHKLSLHADPMRADNLLASVVKKSSSLFTEKELEQFGLQRLLVQIHFSQDKRTVANLIDVATERFPRGPDASAVFGTARTDDDNRIAASRILFRAKKEGWTSSVARDLMSLIQSSDEHTIVSGLWAYASISRDLIGLNETGYSQDRLIAGIDRELFKLFSSASAQLRERILITLHEFDKIKQLRAWLQENRLVLEDEVASQMAVIESQKVKARKRA